MGVVYILKFSSGRYYVGSTADLARRLKQHASGHTNSTKRINQKFELAFSQDLRNLKQAREVERKIKSWKRRDFIEKIIEDGFIKTV